MWEVLQPSVSNISKSFISICVASRYFRSKISLNLQLLMTPSRSICKSKISVFSAKLLWMHNISHHNIKRWAEKCSGCVWRCSSDVTVMCNVRRPAELWGQKPISFCINIFFLLFQWNKLKYPAIFWKLALCTFFSSSDLLQILNCVYVCGTMSFYWLISWYTWTTHGLSDRINLVFTTSTTYRPPPHRQCLFLPLFFPEWIRREPRD